MRAEPAPPIPLSPAVAPRRPVAVGSPWPARPVARRAPGPEPDRRALLHGPITAAVAAYAVDATALDVPADPARVLAELVDLRGGVALAERLARFDADLPHASPSDPAAVRAHLHAGLTEIEAQLDEAFDHAFRPRYRLPTVTRAWQLLVRAGVIDEPRPGPRTRKPSPALRAATRNLWAPFGEFLDTHLKRARFALRDLRGELDGRLCGLGPDAARLVQLDAALHEATRGTTEQWLRRVPQAIEHAFAEALFVAIRGLPAPATVADFAPGFSPEGWLGAALGEGQALVRAVVHHERSRLEALVEAACSA